MKLRITIAGKTYEADVELLEEQEPADPYAFSAASDLPQRKPAHAPQHHASDRVCRSPVTGLVIRVLVQAGQTVERGELLIVLEAMKMETHVTAPLSGTVAKLHVSPGSSVKANQPLIEMEWQDQPAGGSER